MKPYLLLKADGKLYCADIPDPKYSPEGYMMEDHDAAKAEAIANALPVINPDDVGCFGRFKTTFYHYYGKMQVGELYPWNGGAEVEYHDAPKSAYSETFVRLSLPDNKEQKCTCPDDQCLLGDHPTCKWQEYKKQELAKLKEVLYEINNRYASLISEKMQNKIKAVLNYAPGS